MKPIKQPIEIRKENGETVTVQARRVGAVLAVHKSVEPNVDYFVVTHLPTMLECSTLTKLETDSVLIAEYLDKNFPSFTAGKTSAEVVGPLPKWVRRWLMACRSACRFVNPAEYVVEDDVIENDRKTPSKIQGKKPEKVEL